MVEGVGGFVCWLFVGLSKEMEVEVEDWLDGGLVWLMVVFGCGDAVTAAAGVGSRS